MMISPSELLHGADSVAVRVVQPLEFEELKEPKSSGELIEESEDEGNKIEGMDALAQLEARLRFQAEKNETQLEVACEQARTEVREQMSRELEEKIALERDAMVRACDRFTRERSRYFLEVEAEVVRLALAIAARVLHRETELDPMLLRGAVRVALERVQEDSIATLRVPEAQAKTWKEILVEEHRGAVVIVGDSRLVEGECIFETNIGRVDLGVKAQLEEIERGFFDLLQQRPA
ncbi:MAG TPA: FliH/SctL family protein [Edaphobacter sp.]|jgi:flagellar assembly protein FliH